MPRYGKTMLASFGLLLISTTISGCLGQCLTGDDSPSTFDTSSKKLLSQARFDFALDTLRVAAQHQRWDNIFFSPYSLHQALTLAYFSSLGTTEEALRIVLHIPESQSKVDVERFYGFENSLRRFQESQSHWDPGYEFRTANKLWVTNSRRLRGCMLTLFGDQLEQVDFQKNPETIRLAVNDWASNATRGQIRDLLAPGEVSRGSDLILANAVYFKGQWVNRFDPTLTKMNYFTADDARRSLVTFMNQEGIFSHGISDEIGARILELPYKGDHISMYVLLPLSDNDASTERQGDVDTVGQLIQRVTTTPMGRNRLRTLLEKRPDPRPIRVSMPKFSLDKQLPLGDLLNGIGAGELMSGEANLRGLIDEGELNLHLGEAIHRAKIEVNEEGTIAAAVTAILSNRIGSPSIRLDRPFLYLIYEKPSRSILFAGIYRVPT